MSKHLSPFAFEQVQVNDKMQILTSSIYKTSEGVAERAVITCEGECRYRYDDGVPTKVCGHLLRDGDLLILAGEIQIKNFKAFSSDISILSVTYERA